MPNFRYLAKNIEGMSESGTLTASDRREALAKLRAQNLYVVRISEQAVALQQEAPFAGLRARLQERKPKSRDFMVFCRQFATMMQAGITVLQILKIQAQQSETRCSRARCAISLEVERGGDLAGAMEKHGDLFPDHQHG